jgi:hypothetical protein
MCMWWVGEQDTQANVWNGSSLKARPWARAPGACGRPQLARLDAAMHDC